MGIPFRHRITTSTRINKARYVGGWLQAIRKRISRQTQSLAGLPWKVFPEEPCHLGKALRYAGKLRDFTFASMNSATACTSSSIKSCCPVTVPPLYTQSSMLLPPYARYQLLCSIALRSNLGSDLVADWYSGRGCDRSCSTSPKSVSRGQIGGAGWPGWRAWVRCRRPWWTFAPSGWLVGCARD